MTTKKILVEQCLRRIKAGNPSIASNVHEAEVEKAIEQQVNFLLRPQYFETLQTGEGSIPEGCVMVTYTGVPVTSYRDKSKCTLPAIPVRLPKNMGVWHIAASEVTAVTLSAPVIMATVNSATQITLVVASVTNASSYRVEMSFDGNTWFQIGSRAISYVRSGLTTATTYYFRAKAVGDEVYYNSSIYATTNATTS
jgi:hypothetical protein